ncbi:MAG TPA: cobalamin-dependent protein [Acidimicrobiales bacterium]|nr:cobalamin-dependent protein [Acidimicrobiales bacterium]
MTTASATSERIKVLIAVVGLDQHEVGSMVVSRILSQAGMEVVYLGRFNTPATVTTAAIAEDADVVGVSCHSWEYLEFAEDLVARLGAHHIPVVFGGSVITPDDGRGLVDLGAAAVFGSSSSSDEIVDGIRECVDRSRERSS